MIYKYRNEEKSPKDFRNYQHSIELLKNLGDDNTDSKEILKNQINFNQI